MKRSRPAALVAAMLASGMLPPAVVPANAADPEIEALRAEIQRMRNEYQSRIEDLERRLIAAEARSTQAAATAQTASEAAREAARTSAGNSPGGASAFNPAMGAVLVGTYSAFDDEGESELPGFAIDEEAGRGEEGFSVGHSEFNLKANVDDKFLGNVTFAIAEHEGETEVELEEAWVQTTALPYGFTSRFGRFFSDVGYLNQFHVHADDFVDRPLPYRAFLGNQFLDDGVRLSWIAPTDLFVELGAEWLRGAGFPGGGEANEGKGTWTAFSHIGGDVGASNSWRLGLSHVNSEVAGREAGHEDEATSFAGESNLWIADLVWKWAPNGNPVDRFLKLQAEYIQRDEHGVYTLDPEGIGAGPTPLAYSGDSSGWYAQAFYQFTRGWRVGLRHAELRTDEPGAAFAGSALDRQGHDPAHDSIVLEWANSEFSRLRLQFNNNQTMLESDNEIVLQYIMSLGAHGAHKF